MSWLPSGHKAILRSGLWIVLLILVRICLMYLIVKLLMLCTTKCFKSLWRTHNGSLKTRGDKSSFPARRITCFNRDIDWRQFWVKTLPMIYFPGNFLLLSVDTVPMIIISAIITPLFPYVRHDILGKWAFLSMRDQVFLVNSVTEWSLVFSKERFQPKGGNVNWNV